MRVNIFTRYIQPDDFWWLGKQHKSHDDAMKWFIDKLDSGSRNTRNTQISKSLRSHKYIKRIKLDPKFALMDRRNLYWRDLEPYLDLFPRWVKNPYFEKILKLKQSTNSMDFRNPLKRKYSIY